MTRMASFTKLENELTPKFRESTGLAESTADVQKFFVYTMLELCNGVLAGHSEPFEIFYEDIVLTPGESPGYTLSRVPLAASRPMSTTWASLPPTSFQLVISPV